MTGGQHSWRAATKVLQATQTCTPIVAERISWFMQSDMLRMCCLFIHLNSIALVY